MSEPTTLGNGDAGQTLAQVSLLADMQRCLLWMEHENRCAEREEKMGHWLTDHSEAMRQWDAEYMKAREAYVSANVEVSGQRGREKASDCKPDSMRPL